MRTHGAAMKSKADILAHVNNLRVAINMPCECEGTAHAEQCIRGMYMMKAVIQTLLWAVGDNEGMQPMIDKMAKDVVAFKRVN